MLSKILKTKSALGILVTVLFAIFSFVAIIIAYQREKNKKSMSVSEFYNNVDTSEDTSELTDEELLLSNERKEMLL